MPLRHYKEEQYRALEKATEIGDLLPIAESVLKKLNKPIIQVCGPISTGKFDVKTNTKIFEATIKKLSDQGLTIFNQLPFQGAMDRMYKEWIKTNSGYFMPILDDFYTPIFRLGYIQIFYFIPGWEYSFGARWEHDQFHKFGIEVKYLPDDWISSLDLPL